MKTSKELFARIEEELREKDFGSQAPRKLFEPLAYTLSLGGKRVRPLLCLLSAQLFRDDIEPAVPIAVALELFHNFTLLHDDLMDKSPLRRGEPTVYKRWSENVAILSGDVLCIEAYRALEAIEDGVLLKKVLPLFNRMAVEICQGQQYDMDFEERAEVSVREYLEMIRLKTAVLLGAALCFGALASGAEDAWGEELYAVGEALGLAFQIQDDYLDVYAKGDTFGKPIGGDIANGKKTLLLLYAREQLSSDRRAELDRLMALSAEHKEERIKGVTALYDEVGAGIYAQREIKRLTDEALARLNRLGIAPERLRPLYELFDTLRVRES